MDLSISIVSWNTKNIICECIKSILENTSEISYEIIVVDNASSDGTVETIRKLFPSVKVITNNDNIGFARANNKALQICTGNYFLLLNPDTVVLDNSLKLMVDFMNEDTLYRGAVGPMVLNNDKTLQQSWAKLPTFTSEVTGKLNREIASGIAPKTVEELSEHGPFQTGWVGGCCMMVNMKAIAHIGEMDKSIFMYCEETDWCKRLWNAGWQVWLNPKATIMHYGGKSSEQASTRSKKQLIKSKIIYFRKHKNIIQATTLGIILTLKWIAGDIIRKSR